MKRHATVKSREGKLADKRGIRAKSLLTCLPDGFRPTVDCCKAELFSNRLFINTASPIKITFKRLGDQLPCSIPWCADGPTLEH